MFEHGLVAPGLLVVQFFHGAPRETSGKESPACEEDMITTEKRHRHAHGSNLGHSDG
jgi:hypothetical protein